MSKPLVDRIPFAKIVIGLAIVFILSLGLCGLTGVLLMRGNSVPGQMDRLMNKAAGWDIGTMVLSLAGLVATAAAWVLLAVTSRMGKKVSQPQKLFDDEDDTKLDKRE
jgi:hypothetical protein